MENLDIGSPLNRKEMRNITGGECDSSDNCLYCITENAGECWVRSSTSSPAMQECEMIYPSLDINDAWYGACLTTCKGCIPVVD